MFTTLSLFTFLDNPLMFRIIIKFPNPFWARHHIQVIQIISMWRTDWMITTRDLNNILIVNRHGFIQASIICINSLKSKTLGRINMKIIYFFQ